MSIPSFPPIPIDGHVDRIDAAWFRKLKTFCEYAATHPAADNDTLECKEGTMRIRPRGKSIRATAVDSSYVGPWAIADASVGDTKRISVTNTGTLLPDSGHGTRWVGYMVSWSVYPIVSLFLSIPDAAGYWVIVSSWGGVYLLSETIVPKSFEYILGHIKAGVITQIHRDAPIINMSPEGLVYPISRTEDSIVYTASVPYNDLHKTSAGYGSTQVNLTIKRTDTRFIVLRYNGSTSQMTITAEQIFPEPQSGTFIVIAAVTPLGIDHYETRPFLYFAERYVVI